MSTTLIFHSNLPISSHFHHSPSFLLSSSSLFPQKANFYTIPPLKTHYQQTPISQLSRRLFLPSVSGIFDALTGGNSARDSVFAVRRGMQLFKQGDVPGSITEFDKAIELDPRQKAYLWQRGLSLYYADRFEEGAEQFRLDVAQNPNDTEESIWCFLCEAQLYGIDEARTRFLEVGRDSRSVMREAYNMFKDGGDPEKLVSMFLNGKEHEFFYASLYAGLYYESEFYEAYYLKLIYVDASQLMKILLRIKMRQRKIQKLQKFTCWLHVNPHMDQGPMIIWLPSQRSTVFVEIGSPVKVSFQHSHQVYRNWIDVRDCILSYGFNTAEIKYNHLQWNQLH